MYIYIYVCGSVCGSVYVVNPSDSTPSCLLKTKKLSFGTRSCTCAGRIWKRTVT